MKVCITRNAEARTNASIARVSSALQHQVDDVCLLTRNRFTNEIGSINELKYNTSDCEFINYEIGLKSEQGKGLVNIFQLILFQFFVFKWFLKNQEKYDIIHAFDLDTGIPALLISKLTKKKFIYHIADFYVDSRGALPKILKKVIRKLEYFVISKAEVTIVCTEDRIKQIEGSKPKKLVVVHNTPIISDNMKLSINNTIIKDKDIQKEITFTYVGVLSEKRFIKNAINVIKKYPNIYLEIAGMGNISDFVEKASEDYKNISYLGILNYNEALQLYSQTDFMFAIYDPKVANHKFSAPNKVYEAMILGKPIIVANGTGIDEIVTNNKMGISIDYTEEAFERTIFEILQNQHSQLQMSKNAKEAHKKYSWDEMKARLIHVYSQV
jgi:glycosyltransferase involved in cell wall biosynthesis